MKATTGMNDNGGPSNWLVFLGGAAYNLLLTMNDNGLLEFTVRSVIGASVLLCFKLLDDYVSGGSLSRLVEKGRNTTNGKLKNCNPSK